MQIFLFIIDGVPGYRFTLAEAQAVLEDHLIEKHNLSEVQWGDDGDARYGAYLWGFSGENADHSGQIIWPQALTRKERNPALDPGDVEMSLTIRTAEEKSDLTRYIPGFTWEDPLLRAAAIRDFGRSAGLALADHWTTKERT